MDTLAKRIKYAREAKSPKLTQAAIARLFGVSRVSVTLWEKEKEKGGTQPTADKLSRLAAILGVSEEWLISNKGEAPQLVKPQSPSHNDPLLKEIVEGYPKLLDEDKRLLVDTLRRLKAHATSE